MVEVIQSAPSAAGVTPPITKWKKRGPVERVAPSSASAISSVNACSDPVPCMGRVPSIDGAPGGRTSALSTEARYFSASRSTRRSASASCARSAIGSGMADTINGVAVTVVDLGPVVVPVRRARADRDLLRPDHHVVDPVFAHEVERARVALEDLLIVV